MPMLRPAHPCIHRDPKRKDVHVISDGTPKHRYVQHATLARHGPSKKHFIQSNQNLIYLMIINCKIMNKMIIMIKIDINFISSLFKKSDPTPNQ